MCFDGRLRQVLLSLFKMLNIQINVLNVNLVSLMFQWLQTMYSCMVIHMQLMEIFKSFQMTSLQDYGLRINADTTWSGDNIFENLGNLKLHFNQLMSWAFSWFWNDGEILSLNELFLRLNTEYAHYEIEHRIQPIILKALFKANILIMANSQGSLKASVSQ